jgi:deoxyribodipyrimidine photolyase-related protein
MQKILRLILGDQLDDQHSWFTAVNPEVTFTMMEVRQETDTVSHHVQKVAATFAAMRSFADHLRSKGHHLIYLGLDDGQNRQSFQDNVIDLIDRHGFGRFEYQFPDEYRLRDNFARWSARLPIQAQACTSEHFLAEQADFERVFQGKKRLLMETFYRDMRKRYDILMENGKPEGGKWNYDKQNRNRYDERLPLPEPHCFQNDVREIVQMVHTAGVQTIGQIDPGHLIWPVTKAQAEELLDYFIRHCLVGFGTYQDAMTRQSWSLFHARLSFALNTKLLHPLAVIRQVLAAYRRSKGRVALAQVEGFVRQVLGWREYIRCMYWHLMPEFERMNFFNHTAALPEFYWTGETGMQCMRQVIGQSLKHAYAHHIQRLMVTGNFALLAGVAPAEVERWYLGIYIDAIQWVELPNTLGMSQFADGGLLATKPYVCSARYIHRMSDYCPACHYRHDSSVGANACPLNSLFWDFLIRNRRHLQRNARMGMMYRTWEKMKANRRASIRQQASVYLKNLETL